MGFRCCVSRVVAGAASAPRRGGRAAHLAGSGAGNISANGARRRRLKSAPWAPVSGEGRQIPMPRHTPICCWLRRSRQRSAGGSGGGIRDRPKVSMPCQSPAMANGAMPDARRKAARREAPSWCNSGDDGLQNRSRSARMTFFALNVILRTNLPMTPRSAGDRPAIRNSVMRSQEPGASSTSSFAPTATRRRGGRGAQRAVGERMPVKSGRYARTG